jgi:monolysocardiolipin acyltransferase
MLNVSHLVNQRLMRWSLTAHDICFTKRIHSLFFSYGKSIPIVRGSGVFQQVKNVWVRLGKETQGGGEQRFI